jgi:hypothetical protein
MLVENSNQIFHCKKCDYTAKRKGDFNKHLKSKKHNASKMLVKNSKFICKCGKSYTHDSSFYRHSKVCKYKEKSNVIDLIESQAELMGMLKDIIPKVANTTNVNSNNVNSNNNIINVQMYLNENCSDAMSIQNFANQLLITMDDLNKSKPECISNVVLQNLKPLSLSERPFHCKNLKTKEWFVKDETQGWEEDNGDKLIKNAEYGIQKQWTREFERLYPDWMEDDALRERYITIAGSTTSTLTDKVKLKLLRELANSATLENEIMDVKSQNNEIIDYSDFCNT